MVPSRFLLHRRAQLGYSILTQTEREALEASIAPLLGLPEVQWQSARVARLEGEEPFYVVKVDDSLRALVRPTREGPPEVLDLVRHELLQRFFTASVADGACR
jgi:hypothetical protein